MSSSENFDQILKYFSHVTTANTLESIIIQRKVEEKRPIRNLVRKVRNVMVMVPLHAAAHSRKMKETNT